MNKILSFHFYLLFFLGLSIPQHWDIGVWVNGVTIYLEDAISISILLTILFISLAKLRVYYINPYLLALLLFVFIGLAWGLAINGLSVNTFRDLRIVCELLVISYALSIIEFKKSDATFVSKLIFAGLIIYFIQYMYSYLSGSYLMSMADSTQSMGFSRINLSNHVIAILGLPLIYHSCRPLFYPVLTLVCIIALLGLKRTDIGLILLTLLFLLKGMKPKNLIYLLTASILLLISLSQSIFAERFENIVDGSADTRWFGIINAFNMFLDSPWLGFGFGSEMQVTITSVGGVDLSKTYIDNSYITLLFKTGILGFILYFIFYFGVLVNSRNFFYSVQNLQFISFGLFSAFMFTGPRTVLYFFPLLYLTAISINVKNNTLRV